MTPDFPPDLPSEPGPRRAALLALGRRERRDGDPAAALSRCRAVLAGRPDDIEAAILASECLGDQGRAGEAADLLDALAARVPENVHLRHRLGRLARQRGDRALALAHFLAALAADPGHFWAALDSAEELLLLARTDEAEAALGAASAARPGDAQVLFRLGQLARARGDRAAALAHFLAALAADPKNVWAGLEAAQIRADQGETDAAQLALHLLLERHPGDARIMLRLGYLARARGFRAAALVWFRAASAADPALVTAVLETALELIETGALAEAEALLGAMLRRDPANAAALERMAQAAKRRGDEDAALAHLSAAAAADPGRLCALAAEYRARGRFAEARAVLDRAPPSPGLHAERGLIARCEGNHAAAHDAFQAANRLQPREPQHLVEIAREEHALGRPDAAEATLRAALALAPAHPQAVMQLGERMLEAEREEECLDLCRAALARHPMNAWLHHLQARALAARDGAEAALPSLDEAIGRLGDRPELLALRLNLLRRAGQRAPLLAMLPLCQTLSGGSVHLREELAEYRLWCGDLAGLRAGLDARGPADRQEAARTEVLRGDLAAAEWRIADGVAHYRRAAGLNPACAHTAHKLAAALMLHLDLDAATGALRTYLHLQAAARRRIGLSGNPSQTQLGQMLNEFRLDRAVLETLRALRELPTAERVEPLRALVRAHPDHTLAAMSLLLALRQAGLLAAPAGTGAARIPRRIAQYWMQGDVPDDLLPLMESWRRHNPDHAWQLHDHASARAFLAARAPEPVLRAYLRAGEPTQRADLFRLAWLHAEGGVWADADDRCQRPLAAFLPQGAAFVAHQEEFASIGNNFLACVPGHPVIGRALTAASEAINRGDSDLVWLATGPGLLTRAFACHVAEAPSGVADGLGGMAILERWQLAEAADIHCRAAYKRAGNHWSRARIGFQRRGASRG